MNELILEKLSILLNEYPDYITESMVKDVNTDNLLSEEEVVRIIIATLFEFYNNKVIMNEYFKYMFKKLDINDYINNPYLKNIKLDNIKYNNWEIQMLNYKPYELFVYNDLEVINNKIISQVGFFNEFYSYPAILENKRIWMLITPNEINTMKEPINNAFGEVLTYGLGIGYFAYMASIKKNVKSITIIEKDKQVIDLFKKYILPQFEFKEKIKLIESDAIIYAKTKPKFDYVFVDIWHDPSDGLNLYKIFKSLEVPNIKYDYWIEKTIKCYLN